MSQQRARSKARKQWRMAGNPRPQCCYRHGTELGYIDDQPCEGEYKAAAPVASAVTPPPVGNPVPQPPVTRAKHIRQAAQDVLGESASQKTRSPKLSEAIQIWEKLAADDGDPEVLRKFAKYQVDWARGKKGTSDAGLIAAWEDIADALARLKKPSAPAPKSKPKPKRK